MNYRRLIFLLVTLVCLASAPVYGETSLSMGETSLSMGGSMARITLPDGWDAYYSNGQGSYGSVGDIDDALDPSVYWNLIPYGADPNVLLTAKKEYTLKGKKVPATIQIVYNDSYSLVEDGSTIDPIVTAMGIMPYFGAEGKIKKPYEADGNTYQVAEIDKIENDEGGKCYSEVYSTEVESNSISFIMTSYNKPLTKGQKKELKLIVKSFYDEGYYNEIYGSPGQNSGWYDDGSDDETNVLITLLPIFLIVIGIGLKLIKTSSSNTGKVKKVVQSAVTQAKDLGQSLSKDQPEIKVSRDKSEASQDTGQGYVNSLQTLYESGLLTKKELNDMLEKHTKRR